ncbi:MAG: hypothetical protein IKG15_09525 [Solobacterium sp.]|nr:hypothetical protein [Solobacterium sp.]
MYKTALIEQIRILPNSKKEFPTLNWFKHFLTKRMKDRGGYYYFPGNMMDCPNNTLVLFQYDGKIVASGILIDARKQKGVNEKGENHEGYYKFDMSTVKILSRPIMSYDIKRINPDFKSFNQSKQYIPMEYAEELLALLNKLI